MHKNRELHMLYPAASYFMYADECDIKFSRDAVQNFMDQAGGAAQVELGQKINLFSRTDPIFTIDADGVLLKITPKKPKNHIQVRVWENFAKDSTGVPTSELIKLYDKKFTLVDHTVQLHRGALIRVSGKKGYGERGRWVDLVYFHE